MIMKESDWEDIEVNERSTDKVFFESSLLQNISDSIDFLKQGTTEIFMELDSTELKQRIDEFDLEEFSENTINRIDDIFDEVSQFKDEVIDSQDVPDSVKEFSKNTRAYLNRDIIYVKKAQRKLELSSSYDASYRAIELCDKAIDVNEFNCDAYYFKGQALINLRNYEESIEEFINVLALDDEYLEARIAIADANRLNKDYDDAIDVYDSVLNIDAECCDAIKGKALVYAELEDYKKACDLFKKADSISNLNENTRDVWDLCLDKLD